MCDKPEVEIVFDNERRKSVIPRVSIEQANKIKSETSQYLKDQIGQRRRKRRSEVQHSTLKLKSVKYANGITKKTQNDDIIELDVSTVTDAQTKDVSKGKDQISASVQHAEKNYRIVQCVSPATPIITKQANESEGQVQVSGLSQVKKNNSTIHRVSHMTPTDIIEESSESKGQVQISPLVHETERNKENVHSVSPAIPSNINGQGNESKGKDFVQQPEKNNGIVHCVSSTTHTKVNGQVNECDGEYHIAILSHQTEKNIVPNASPITPTKINKESYESEGKSQFSVLPSFTQQNVRLSSQLSKRPKKFSISGSPASSSKNRYLYSSVKKTSKSVPPLRNPTSPPLTFMRYKFDKTHTPAGRRVKRQLVFPNNSFGFSSTQENETFSFDENSLDDRTESAAGTSQTNLDYNDGYLLRQLKLHVNTVLEDSNYQTLINDKERTILHHFLHMDSKCKDLYARMHSRQHKWNRFSDIKYNSAGAENVQILEENGFFETDMNNLDVSYLLDFLKFREIKELCKSYGIKCSTQNKKNCSEEMKRYCHQQKTINFKEEIVSSEELVRKKIKKILGPCFILSQEPRELFRRIHLLFNLKFNRNEQSRFGSQDLFEIQFVGTEKALYPKYCVDKTAKIFSSREELLRFQIAEDLKMDFHLAVDKKDWNKAEKILGEVRNNFLTDIYSNCDSDESASMNTACKLPLSLRKFTPGTVYAYTLCAGVDVLKKLKKKEQAVNDLLLLLDQNTYLPYMRGRWYEKLIIIYRTSGQLKKVAETIDSGMHDPHMDDLGFYMMSCRCRELLKRKKGVAPEVKLLLQEIRLFSPLESVEPTEINACALDGKSGYKRVYIQDDETGDGKIYSSVEELAKNHYCPRFFKRGIHAENSLVSSLFGVLFWDVIYDGRVPCAFISEYQSKPLDLSSGEFYKNRQTIIDAKLVEMSKWTAAEIASCVKDIYDQHNGRSSLVHWKWFGNSELLVDIINCIGLEIILKMCERYARNYRGVRSGFPDLFLWTPGQKDQYKFVEVKGPNDKLAANQKLWLDFLVKNNANVEVCLVKAQGSKTVKTTTALEPSSSNNDEMLEKRETVED